eukprot:COSAG02_NODE_5004_length_4727_cov_1.535220_3_plen_77_part_00
MLGVTRQLVVDQSKPFSLVKLVGPRAAVCRRYEEILPHGSKVGGSKTHPCRAGSRFPWLTCSYCVTNGGKEEVEEN